MIKTIKQDSSGVSPLKENGKLLTGLYIIPYLKVNLLFKTADKQFQVYDVAFSSWINWPQ